MNSLAIQLPDELNQFVLSAVESGGYHNADEFFVSMLSSFKEQVESPLSEEEAAKLASLRADIQYAVEQAERGEVIHDFNMAAFLVERHREHTAHQTA
jgi:Arc/MetJ-type ribon-helix-helix transcriptional regulator